jgi:hypothetical protein
MGAWGTGISSNDTYSDVYAEFFDLYDEGMSVPEISTKLLSSFRETIDDPDDANNFWFALGRAQWECKELDPALLTRIERIVESGTDIEVWRQLDASEADLKKRAVALDRFLEKLRSEKPKARKRKKRVIRQPVFEKGECLVFRLENGNYGGAVVLEAVSRVGFGLNLVATTRINQVDLPAVQDFTSAEVMVKNFGNWKNEREVGWRNSIRFSKEKDLFQGIGKIFVEKRYDPDDYSQGFFYGGFWRSIIEVAGLQFASEEKIAKPKNKVMVKDVISSGRWKFWK